MANIWDHLSNARHIDTIIDSVVKYPGEWKVVWQTAFGPKWHEAWFATNQLVNPELWESIKNTIRSISLECFADDAVEDTILALIAYDDCGYMLESDPGELEILAKFGDKRAILLLPACKALVAIKEKNEKNYCE